MGKHKKKVKSSKSANKLDKKLEGMRDAPVHSISSSKTSAAGMIGYYHADTPKADTKMAFRLAAAKK